MLVILACMTTLTHWYQKSVRGMTGMGDIYVPTVGNSEHEGPQQRWGPPSVTVMGWRGAWEIS